jgi:hypothetical protein
VFLDHLLAEIARATGTDVVLIVTEPGRVAASAATGLFGLAGAVQASTTAVQARDVDVAPTVLHTLGIPISRELPGAPVLTLFNRDFVRRYPVRQVATYGPPSREHANRSGQPLDQEMIDRLRSLGYVK